MIKQCISIILFFVFLSLASTAQIKKYIRKAGKATENGKYETARDYYFKALKVDSNNYNANFGAGVILSDFLGRHEQAIPYLEKSLKMGGNDPSPDIYYALAKSYHHIGRYDDALTYYNKMSPLNSLEDDNEAFHLELEKQINDCNYAKEHSETAPVNSHYIVNLGKTINNATPEYVPVFLNDNKLIFTSKRQDDSREKLNEVDGKYFESMYISSFENGKFSTPKRYAIPDAFLTSKNFRKHHESIVSMSPDGTKLYSFKDERLYESDINEITKKAPSRLSKDANFEFYQNHVSVDKDNKTLYFSSESLFGEGGLDIYKSEKQADGSWGNPVSLDIPINTKYDEDSPYITDDGKTLYFASKGHPGYGGYDMYKSTLVDGKWTEPVNLGKPINSSAHDAFLALSPDGTFGYFSSGRTGGQGDMDLYRINYTNEFLKKVQAKKDNRIAINAIDLNENDFTYKISALVPEPYKNNVLSYKWTVDNTSIAPTTREYDYDFKKEGSYKVATTVVAYCDTCLEPFIGYADTVLTPKGKEYKDANIPIYVTKTSATDYLSHQIGANVPQSLLPNVKTYAWSIYDINNTQKALYSNTNKDYAYKFPREGRYKVSLVTTLTCDTCTMPLVKNTDTIIDINKYQYMSANDLAGLGFDITPVYFDLNKSTIRPDAKDRLNKNIDVLQRYKELALELDGYADSRGSASYNITLSKNRAMTVKNYIVKSGVTSSRILKVTGRGETNLLNHCKDGVTCSEDLHQLNRRVEFKVIKR